MNSNDQPTVQGDISRKKRRGLRRRARRRNEKEEEEEEGLEGEKEKENRGAE